MNPAYRVRSDETWAKARADYLAGDSGRAVCERYDLGESAFNKRAREEGWRRADQADPDPVPDEPPPPARAFSESMRDCLARADDALRRGRPTDAGRFLDLAARYEALAWEEASRQRDARRQRPPPAAEVQKVQRVQSRASPLSLDAMEALAASLTTRRPSALPAAPTARAHGP
jgi:hypothetical protein